MSLSERRPPSRSWAAPPVPLASQGLCALVSPHPELCTSLRVNSPWKFGGYLLVTERKREAKTFLYEIMFYVM